MIEQWLDKPVELADYLRSLSSPDRMSAIDTLIGEYPTVADTKVLADIVLSVLDVIYDDVTAVELHRYLSTVYPTESVRAIHGLDADYCEQRLRERGLLYNDKGSITLAKDSDLKLKGKLSGTIVERMNKMVEYTSRKS